jgi:hypothetical protein
MFVVLTAFLWEGWGFSECWNTSSTSFAKMPLMLPTVALIPGSVAFTASAMAANTSPGDGNSSQPPQPMIGFTVESHHWILVVTGMGGLGGSPVYSQARRGLSKFPRPSNGTSH